MTEIMNLLKRSRFGADCAKHIPDSALVCVEWKIFVQENDRNYKLGKKIQIWCSLCESLADSALPVRRALDFRARCAEAEPFLLLLHH